MLLFFHCGILGVFCAKPWPDTGQEELGGAYGCFLPFHHFISPLPLSHFFPCIISFLPAIISVLPFHHLFFLFCYIIPFPLYLIGNQLCFESYLLNPICAIFVCSWLFLIEMLEPALQIPKFFSSVQTPCLIFLTLFLFLFFISLNVAGGGGFPSGVQGSCMLDQVAQ